MIWFEPWILRGFFPPSRKCHTIHIHSHCVSVSNTSSPQAMVQHGAYRWWDEAALRALEMCCSSFSETWDQRVYLIYFSFLLDQMPWGYTSPLLYFIYGQLVTCACFLLQKFFLSVEDNTFHSHGRWGREIGSFGTQCHFLLPFRAVFTTSACHFPFPISAWLDQGFK